jgi:hypothetical protein
VTRARRASIRSADPRDTRKHVCRASGGLLAGIYGRGCTDESHERGPVAWALIGKSEPRRGLRRRRDRLDEEGPKGRVLPWTTLPISSREASLASIPTNRIAGGANRRSIAAESPHRAAIHDPVSGIPSTAGSTPGLDNGGPVFALFIACPSIARLVSQVC